MFLCLLPLFVLSFSTLCVNVIVWRTREEHVCCSVTHYMPSQYWAQSELVCPARLCETMTHTFCKSTDILFEVRLPGGYSHERVIVSSTRAYEIMLHTGTSTNTLVCHLPLIISLFLSSPSSLVDLCELLQCEGGHQSAGLVCRSKAPGTRNYHHHRLRQDWPRYFVQTLWRYISRIPLSAGLFYCPIQSLRLRLWYLSSEWRSSLIHMHQWYIRSILSTTAAVITLLTLFFQSSLSAYQLLLNIAIAEQ